MSMLVLNHVLLLHLVQQTASPEVQEVQYPAWQVPERMRVSRRVVGGIGNKYITKQYAGQALMLEVCLRQQCGVRCCHRQALALNTACGRLLSGTLHSSHC